MREFCPESELIAAFVERRLTADEQWQVENHAAACDECRRELALVQGQTHAAPSEMPSRLKLRVKGALAQSLHRAGGTRRKTRSMRVARSSPLWALAGSFLIFAAAVLVLAAQLRRKTDPTAPLVVESPRTRPAPTPSTEESRDLETDLRAPLREWPPQIPEESVPTEKPKSEDDPPVIVDPPEEIAPKPETKPLPSPTETVARILDGVTLTDVVGEFIVERAGKKEKVRGIVTVSSGDVLAAEKTSAFHVEGRHGIVMPSGSRISVASSIHEQATWIAVHAGDALIEPAGMSGSRWVVTDGRSVVLIDKTRGRFSVARKSDGPAITALSDGLKVSSEGGTPETLRAGEAWHRGTVTPSDREGADLAQLEANLPRERSLFFATCDREDLRRGRWTVREGGLEREGTGKAVNSYLRSVDKRDHHKTEVRIEHRVAWDLDLVLRFRYRTNARRLRVEILLPRSQGMLLAEVAVNRESANRWVTVELPLHRFQVIGTGPMTLTSYDRLESLEFRVAQNEIYAGGTRGYVGVDDLQILER